jgi:hypothetical protein
MVLAVAGIGCVERLVNNSWIKDVLVSVCKLYFQLSSVVSMEATIAADDYRLWFCALMLYVMTALFAVSESHASRSCPWFSPQLQTKA